MVHATDVPFSPPYTGHTISLHTHISCTSTVPTSQGPTPHAVQNHHILRQEESSIASKIWSVRREVLSLLICSVRYFVYPICYGDTAMQNYCTFFPLFRANHLGRIEFNVWGNYWHKSSRKMCIIFTPVVVSPNG